ncbi:MarR family transcriptional regulator [Limosilactobacillus sp.]|uniref:MarR family transcriptional regulator n=1 Tax=Limosilactobacillus sp. TaxID=2773925 RepID=UPI003F0C70C2
MNTDAITDIRQTIERLRTQHGNAHGSKEQQWIQAHLTDDRLGEIVLKLSIVAFHILSTLEAGAQTGIEIADKINVTRGGVTRAAKKLLQYNLINAEKHPDDKKKIYYSLTADGQTVAKVHDQLHELIKKRLVNKLTVKYSPDQLQVVAAFLNDLYRLEQDF